MTHWSKATRRLLGFVIQVSTQVRLKQDSPSSFYHWPQGICFLSQVQNQSQSWLTAGFCVWLSLSLKIKFTHRIDTVSPDRKKCEMQNPPHTEREADPHTDWKLTKWLTPRGLTWFSVTLSRFSLSLLTMSVGAEMRLTQNLCCTQLTVLLHLSLLVSIDLP